MVDILTEMVNCSRKLWILFVVINERNFTAMGAHAYAELWEDGRHFVFAKSVTDVVSLRAMHPC